MNLIPSLEQIVLLLAHDPHGAANLALLHLVGPHELRLSIAAHKIDLRLTIAENVDVRRFGGR
jgi:hypothetical protein